PPFYDSMMAKVIAWAPDRPEALARMARALREFRIEGVPTTIPFHLAVLANPSFAAGRIDTRFAETAVSEEAVRAAAQSLRAASQSRRTAAQPSRTAAPAAAAQAGGGPGAGQADAAPPHDAAHASRRLAAIAAAVAAVIDRPHRIVSVAPVPQAPTRFLWGAAGRFELMARRRLANPAMDRRNHRADRPWPPQTFHDHRRRPPPRGYRRGAPDRRRPGCGFPGHRDGLAGSVTCHCRRPTRHGRPTGPSRPRRPGARRAPWGPGRPGSGRSWP